MSEINKQVLLVYFGHCIRKRTNIQGTYILPKQTKVHEHDGAWAGDGIGPWKWDGETSIGIKWTTEWGQMINNHKREYDIKCHDSSF